VVEGEISALEEKIAVVSSRLEHPPAEPAEVLRLGQDYQHLHAALELRLKEWSDLSEETSS